MSTLKFIIYSRKSKTAQDGRVQHTHRTSEWHIRNYLQELDKKGVKYEILGAYEENISGGGYYTKRPIFRELVERCKEDQSLTLLVSKADRLARNVRSGTELMETINFVLANAPDADDLQKQLEFMIAEREYTSISTRYKDMYQAKKDRCEKSGEKLIWGANSPKHKATYQKNKAAGLHKLSQQHASAKEVRLNIVKSISNIIKINPSALTFQQLADNLNTLGITTPKGKAFSKGTVSRIADEFKLNRLSGEYTL